MRERPSRAEAPVDQTWDLTDIYSSPAQWAEDVARVDDDIQALAAYQGRLGVDGATLLACLQAHDTLSVRLHHLRMYAYFNLAADGGAAENQAMSVRGDALAAGLDQHKATLATALGIHIRQNVTLARLRGYNNSP